MSLNPFIFIYMAKSTWNMKSTSQNCDPSTKFQLNPSKNIKVGLWPQDKEWRNYSEPVMKSSILLWFWIEFVTYFNTTKFGFNWPSNNGNKEGVPPPPHTWWIFQTPYHLGLTNGSTFTTMRFSDVPSPKPDRANRPIKSIIIYIFDWYGVRAS